VLRHVHRYSPNLVPEPIAADLDSVPPAVTMSVVPGEPLAGDLTSDQVEGLVAAVTALWAVPHDELGPWRDDLRFARQLTGGPRPAGGVAAAAYDAALSWWSGSDRVLLRSVPPVSVLGHRGWPAHVRVGADPPLAGQPAAGSVRDSDGGQAG
jgi:hypothetical protein